MNPAPPRRWDALPLFPLGTVLYPDGVLRLKVFEARYLDLMSRCRRSGEPFAVVALRSGAEVRQAGAAAPEWCAVATLATLQEMDAPQPGILMVQCTGTHRVRLGAAREGPLGLWLAEAEVLSEEAPQPVPAALATTAHALARAAAALSAQGRTALAPPHRFDDAGWVAHRWCELLPLPMPLRQQLLEIDDPVLRLNLVAGFLRHAGIVGASTDPAS